MKRRTTYVHDPNQDFDPSSVKITKGRLEAPGINAAREEQLKFSLDELPDELRHLLSRTHEFHIRWATELHFDTISPYLSRVAPGLHVFYTPSAGADDFEVCPMLHKAFSDELNCQSPNTTFTKPSVPSSEFTYTPSLHYFSELPAIDQFVDYLGDIACPDSSEECLSARTTLRSADSVDVSWDIISSTLTFSAFWSKPTPNPAKLSPATWDVSVKTPPANSRVEVGFLSAIPAAADAHDLTASGFLHVLGDDTDPKPTRFSFPSRHHSLAPTQPQPYTASIQQPQGLHPTLHITFPKPSTLTSPLTKPADSTCALHLHLTLPSHTFIDPYALKPSDANFVSSTHIAAVHSTGGYTDLEAPAYLPSTPWGSSVLLEALLPPPNHPPTTPWQISIPLHLRYQPPSPTPHKPTTLPYPQLFWACTATAGTRFTTNPFDRQHTAYDAAFGPLTMFYHLSPLPTNTTTSNTLTLPLQTPVLNTNTTTPLTLELATLATIALGFAWVALKLWPALKDELRAYLPATLETTQPMNNLWKEPVRGGPPSRAVRRRA
jgi:hypothetical protein